MTPLPVENGWWPRLSWPYVLLGNRVHQVFDLRDMSFVRSGDGWQHGWWTRVQYVVSRPVSTDDEDREVWVYDVRDGSGQMVHRGRVGNEIAVAPGHIVWATTDGIYDNGTRIASGRYLPQSPRANGNIVAITEWSGYPSEADDAYTLTLMHYGQLAIVAIRLTNPAPKVIPGPAMGAATYGYFGPAYLYNGFPSDTDISVTPWHREAPPFVVEANGAWWGARGIEWPDGTPGLAVGPISDFSVIQRRGIPVVWCDVQWYGGKLHVVTCGPRGEAFYEAFDLNEPRAPLTYDIPVPEPEPPPTYVAPGIDVIAYGDTLSPSRPWSVSWKDRNNPGVSGAVDIRGGSVYVTLRNPAGEDQTGRYRPVRIECPEVPNPDPGPPDPPSDVDVHYWRGNFLAFPDYPYAFMYPSWDYGKRARFRSAYRQEGLTHLPFGVWGAYPGQGLYDFRGDPSAFRIILGELIADGLVPCVFAHTDAVIGRGPMTRDALEQWAGNFLPRISDLVQLWCTGWEFNQIDQTWGGYWTGDGSEHLAWVRTLRSILGPAATIYTHFSPERITGYPNYPDHSGPQDEASWWKDHNPLNGLLYQRRPDEPERFVLAHTLGGEAVDSSIDVGDVYRISGDRWGLKSQHLDFVFFEHSREFSRWERLTNAVKDHPLVAGFC